MSAYSMESIDGMSSLELTLIAFQSGRVIAGAHHQMSPAEEQAKETFVAAYMELLRRPPETGTVHSRSSRSPLTWKCSHVGFEMSHPQFGMVGMVRDRRSSSGYPKIHARPVSRDRAP